jgi:hypothetical protein
LLAKRKAATYCKPPYLLEYISKPSITFPAFKVREVLLIGISLLLKRYCPISLMAVSEDDKSDEPFDKIPNIKENVKHFLHLLGMYLFVIERYITNLFVSSCEENPEEVHVTETSRGNNSVLYYLYTFVFKRILLNLYLF